MVPPSSESVGARAVEPAGAAGLSGAALTFLFTDVEGSTRLWEQNPGDMQRSLERHEVLLRAAIAGADGEVVKTTGDGLMAVFAAPLPAVTAAIEAQRALAAEPWSATCPIRVRTGIHTARRRPGVATTSGPR